MKKPVFILLLACSWLLLTPMLAAQTSAPKRGDDSVLENIKPYAECRAIAQDLASEAKQKFKDDPKALAAAREKYRVAFAKSEAYLAKLEISVARGKRVSFKKEATELVDSVKALNDVARPGTRLAGIGIAELIKGLIDGAIAIWKEYHGQQQAEIDRVLGIIRSKQWLSWDKIGS